MESEGTMVAQVMSTGARSAAWALQHGFSSTPAPLFHFHVGNQ
jgi:hypothetical protein